MVYLVRPRVHRRTVAYPVDLSSAQGIHPPNRVAGSGAPGTGQGRRGGACQAGRERTHYRQQSGARTALARLAIAPVRVSPTRNAPTAAEAPTSPNDSAFSVTLAQY